MPEPRTVEPANLRVVATGLRFPEGPVAMADGSVIVTEIAAGRLTRVRPDGTTEVVAETGGGPNGAAIGPDGAMYVTNNGGCFDFHERMGMLFPGSPPLPSWPGHGSLQRVDLVTGETTALYEACDGNPLRAPNDLVFDRDGGIWFTDHGVREGRRSDRTGIYYAAADGSSITEAIFPLDAPNGIGLSPAGDKLYSAETHTGRLWAWDVTAPGTVGGDNPFGPGGGTPIYDPGGYMLYDSLAVDGEGWVCVATLVHGGITAVSPDGTEAERIPLADPLTTNICFGADGTAFATLSGTGALVAFDWHRTPGTLVFNA
ncbi:MAG: SMP-30/gluconolactonase/LRE family protein [Acidimicrobiia bacterium]|nr:SMP-30/gluconolactonase/LRE family protein [Acidimicrobiia bacterium]